MLVCFVQLVTSVNNTRLFATYCRQKRTETVGHTHISTVTREPSRVTEREGCRVTKGRSPGEEKFRSHGEGEPRAVELRH